MSKTTRRDALKGATLAGLASITQELPAVARCQLQDQTKSSGRGPSDLAAIQAAQEAANSKPGPRSVPAKIIPVPTTDVDPATAALVAAPYSQLWNLNAPDDAGWRAIVKQVADETLPRLAQARLGLGVSIEPATVGGVKAFILTPKKMPEAHKTSWCSTFMGGGYIFGPGESGTGEAMLMAAYGGYKVIAIDYRMPPDAPYPAAMNDVTAAWKAAVATTDPRRTAVEGTSAGGGMAFALMLRTKAEGLPLPGAIATGSPAADLTNTGDSYKTNEWVDNVLVSFDGYPSRVAQLYAHGHDLKDPQLSPIYGDFHGLAPAILTTGTRDLILSATVRTHRKLRRAGVEADLQVYEGLSHSQFLFDPSGTVPKEVFGEITRFLDAHLPK
jgi:monoterpene epsilon-lactone hydrolase